MDGELRRHPQRGGPRQATASEKMQQGCVTRIEIGEGGFQRLHRRIQNALHNATLFVGKERGEREAALSEVVIHEPDDLGKIARIDRVFDLLRQHRQRLLLL